jgi:hypothetical protein
MHRLFTAYDPALLQGRPCAHLGANFLPRSPSLSLYCSSDDSPKAFYNPLISIFSAHFQALGTPILSLFTIYFCTSDDPWSFLPSGPLTQTTHRMTYIRRSRRATNSPPGYGGSLSSLLLQVFRALPLSVAHTLIRNFVNELDAHRVSRDV